MSKRIIASWSPNSVSASARASSVLPTPGGPRKRNEPTGRFASPSPARRTPDRAGDRLDGLVLPHHPLVHLGREAEQPLALLLGQLRDRDSGPARHDLGDVVGEHLAGAQ